MRRRRSGLRDAGAPVRLRPGVLGVEEYHEAGHGHQHEQDPEAEAVKYASQLAPLGRVQFAWVLVVLVHRVVVAAAAARRRADAAVLCRPRRQLPRPPGQRQSPDDRRSLHRLACLVRRIYLVSRWLSRDDGPPRLRNGSPDPRQVLSYHMARVFP